jgi:hypothetical protein
VVITTRHDSHAGLVIEALQAGKHVFVEKPLCLTLADLARDRIEAAPAARPPDGRLQPPLCAAGATQDRSACWPAPAGPKALS